MNSDCERKIEVTKKKTTRRKAKPAQRLVRSAFIRAETLPGADVVDVIRDLIEMSTRLMVRIAVDYNGIELFISPHSNPEHVYKRYWQKIKRQIAAEKPPYILERI